MTYDELDAEQTVIVLTRAAQSRVSGRELPQDAQKGKPVSNLSIEFAWQDGTLYELFERQVELIRQDIYRARVAGRLVIYLSCPLSSRGGGYAATNVEIALHTQNRLQREWGDRFWFLNPAEYQMESRAGTGLILRHARQMMAEGKLTLDEGEKLEDKLAKLHPSGGDYMRMWTRVLTEDVPDDHTALQLKSDGTVDFSQPSAELAKNIGGRFAGFYFVGPSDAADFFRVSGATNLTAAVEAYFTRKLSIDPFFKKYFTPQGDDPPAEKAWDMLRRDFVRFYANRYGANYSLGCHDEWNIWCAMNLRRIQILQAGSQIAGYFEGRQIDLSSTEQCVSPGYATSKPPYTYRDANA